MDSLGTLLAVIAWFVGVPLIVVAILRAGGYDWQKTWLMWRTEAGPLPFRVYLVVIAFVGLGVIIAALTR